MKALPQNERDQIKETTLTQRDDAVNGPAPGQAEPQHGYQLSQLPAGPAARSLRQAVVRQAQQSQGNTAVQRALTDRVDRQPEDQAPATTPTDTTTTPDAGPGTPTEISSGGASVRVTPGTVDISGGIVNIDAAMVRSAGVMQTDTLIANTVVGSTYTPGVGNVQ
jgi:hypothetical protein